MRTPTQAILSFSELMLANPERSEEFIWAIRKHVNRLQRLSNDIVFLTRIESRSLKLNKEKFDLNEIMNNLLNQFRTQIPRGNALQLLLVQPEKEEPILVDADKDKIRHVISNLMDNALKFTNEGTIFVTLEKNEVIDGNKIVIASIRDSGSGLTPEILSQISLKSTPSFAGIGLGLAVSKGIIEAHGGIIWAENNNNTDNNGKGATVYFSLPLNSS